MDATKKELVLNVLENASVKATAISINVGFAINNGANFDDYVRFAFDVTVTILGRIVVANTIPAGDYSAFSIEFADYQEVIESCLGLTLSEFITACKDPGRPDCSYMVDSESGEWNTTSDYTAGGSGIGYWLTTSNLKVTNWSDDGSTGSVLFVETQENGDMVNSKLKSSFNFRFCF